MFVCVFGSFAIIGCLFLFRNVHLKCVFNQIILLLSVSHLIFLLAKFFSYLAIHMGYSTLVLIYPTMLHPLTALSMTLSIYFTMSLSVHVFKLIYHPAGHNIHFLMYMVPVFLLSVCFNIPKFLESSVEFTEAGDVHIWR